MATRFNLKNLDAILASVDGHYQAVPSFDVPADAVKRHRAGDTSDGACAVIAAIKDRLTAMLKAAAGKTKIAPVRVSTSPGVAENGSLAKFVAFRFCQSGDKLHGVKQSGPVLWIASEMLDDPEALGMALLYATIVHVGATTGTVTASDRARSINAHGAAIAADLGCKVPDKAVKPGGTVHFLKGRVPTITAEFLQRFDLVEPFPMHGARPDGWTWSQMESAILVLRAAVKPASDWITLDCTCPDRKNADGEAEPVQHRARISDVNPTDGAFRTACIDCGTAWILGENDKGKTIGIQTTISDVLNARTAARKAS